MKFGKGKDKSIIHYNDFITVHDIPLEAGQAYVVNGKPAIEWVLERQAVTTDKASGIVKDANAWATETVGDARYPLSLLLRVITVSLETMRIVRESPTLDILEEASHRRRRTCCRSAVSRPHPRSATRTAFRSSRSRPPQAHGVKSRKPFLSLTAPMSNGSPGMAHHASREGCSSPASAGAPWSRDLRRSLLPLSAGPLPSSPDRPILVRHGSSRTLRRAGNTR